VKIKDPFVPPTEPAADAIDGADPGVGYIGAEVTAYRLTCDCGVSLLHVSRADAIEAWEEHHRFGHPAYRNPAIACQATPIYDHERWCIRPKDHEGPHWTPSYAPAGSWWPR
jgi:hypothetical protein